MASQVVTFAGLSDRDRKAIMPLPKLAKGDRVELRVHHKDGSDQTLALPAVATSVVQTLIDRLASGERVAVLTEDRELSPTQASTILGVSRPLIVLRMDRGDLPFHYVGKHRRAKLKDVLALKTRLDAQRQAMEALADDAEDLRVNYGA
jgi:excisionase family DNA binding protein